MSTSPCKSNVLARLSGFAALAAFFGGTATGTAGALLAFAVMLWYVSSALLIALREMYSKYANE